MSLCACMVGLEEGTNADLDIGPRVMAMKGIVTK